MRVVKSEVSCLLLVQLGVLGEAVPIKLDANTGGRGVRIGRGLAESGDALIGVELQQDTDQAAPAAG